jgi:hypothetical protein
MLTLDPEDRVNLVDIRVLDRLVVAGREVLSFERAGAGLEPWALHPFCCALLWVMESQASR